MLTCPQRRSSTTSMLYYTVYAQVRYTIEFMRCSSLSYCTARNFWQTSHRNIGMHWWILDLVIASASA